MPLKIRTLDIAQPEVAMLLHSSMNMGLSAASITASSKKKVWWQCPNYVDHTWEARVDHVVGGSRCPYCSGRKVLAGYNDLATKRPDIAAQWHPTLNEDILPTMVTVRDNTKRWWVCSDLGHTWLSKVDVRTRNDSGCPVCSNKVVLAGFNDLAFKHPEVASQWHPTKNGDLRPHEVTPTTKKKVWWQCAYAREHAWEATVGARVNGTGCPYCSGRVAAIGTTDLVASDPQLAAQWHPTLNNHVTPSSVTSGSNFVAWWVCDTNPQHEWQARLYSRKAGHGCPYCANQKVLQGENDLSTTAPELALQWHPDRNTPLTPEDVTKSSSVSVWWMCPDDATHEWEAVIASRSSGVGCPRCAQSARSSKAEYELYEFLMKLGVRPHKSVWGTIFNQELDIYLPEAKFAIEFNGLYWHSEKFKSATYHQDKFDACSKLGITLYQVWEDDWKFKREVVLRGIAHRLGLSHRLPEALENADPQWYEVLAARKTQVVEVAYDRASAFLDAHHIQGKSTGSRYYGLEDASECLRAVIGLSETQRGSGEVRIDRYATLGVVQGGFTKLLKHVERTLKPRRIVTFADRSISNGGLYESNGFVAEAVIPPDYSYFVGQRRVHKFNYRLERFKTDPSLSWQEGFTERQLADLNGLLRVWDSGKIRYVKMRS